MPTVITTPGAPNANSYATLAEGETYHGTRLHVTDWTAASQDTKERALIMATRVLDAMYEWASSATYSTQALQWPRTGVVDVLRLSYIGEAVIPQRLKEATAEFARQLIAEDRTVDSEIEAKGITSLTAGPVSLDFDSDVKAKPVPDAVMALIPEWWGYAKSAIMDTRPLLRA